MSNVIPGENTDNPLAGVTTYSSGVAQATAFRIVKKHTTAALQSYELTCMQWFTIGTVYEARTTGIRISDLARELDTTLAYTTTTVNYLESRGILTKTTHGTDARTKLVHVNPKYKNLVIEIENHVRKTMREVLYSNMTSKELADYIKVLYKISSL